jgi:hypothetical protein
MMIIITNKILLAVQQNWGYIVKQWQHWKAKRIMQQSISTKILHIVQILIK